MSAYTQAIVKEIEAQEPFLAKAGPASSVFIGGGTPTVIPITQLERIIDAVRENIPLDPEAEFTVEANTFKVGDKMLITGPTTGVMYVTADEIHGDNGPVEVAEQGTRVSIAVPSKVRPSDKLFKLEKVEEK